MQEENVHKTDNNSFCAQKAHSQDDERELQEDITEDVPTEQGDKKEIETITRCQSQSTKQSIDSKVEQLCMVCQE